MGAGGTPRFSLGATRSEQLFYCVEGAVHAVISSHRRSLFDSKREKVHFPRTHHRHLPYALPTAPASADDQR